MTIRYLEIFVEVCKYMNMSRAAQSLMISQSSVSQAVKALEKRYNVLLFERLNHNLYLTAAGEKDAVPCNAGFKKHRALEFCHA